MDFGWLRCLRMGVCISAVWQHREESIEEGSRRILLKNAVLVMGS